MCYIWKSLRVSHFHCLIYHCALRRCLYMFNFEGLFLFLWCEAFPFLLSQTLGAFTIFIIKQWSFNVWYVRKQGSRRMRTPHTAQLWKVSTRCRWTLQVDLLSLLTRWWKCSCLNLISGAGGGRIWVSLPKDLPSIKSLINDFLKSKENELYLNQSVKLMSYRKRGIHQMAPSKLDSSGRRHKYSWPTPVSRVAVHECSWKPFLCDSNE